MHPRSNIWHLLDYVIVRQSDRSDVQITRVMRGAELSTDHRLVVSRMALAIRPPIRKRTGKKKVCVYKLQNAEIRTLYQNEMEEAIGRANFGNMFDQLGSKQSWSNF